jgi:PST family polysaccharide transporter
MDMKRSVLWSLGEAAVTLATSLVMVLLVARLVGPHAFGLAAIAVFAGALAETLVAIPFAEPLIQRRDVDETVINTAHSCMSLAGAAAFVLMLAAAPLIAYAYGVPELIGLVAVQGLTCLALGVRGAPEALLAKGLAFRSLAIRGMVAKLSGGVASVLLALGGAGAWSIVVGNVMYALAATALVWAATSRKIGFGLDINIAASLFRFGRFTLADALLTVAGPRLYGFLAAFYFGLEIFGQIGVAFRISDAVIALLSAITVRMALPIFSTMASDPHRLFGGWVTGTHLILIIATPVFLGLASTGPEIIWLILGPEWSSAVPALAAVCVYSVFNLAAVLVQPAIKAAGRPALLLYLHAVTLAFLIAASVVTGSFGLNPFLATYAMMGAVYFATALALLQRAAPGKPFATLSRIGRPALLAGLLMVAVLGLERTLLGGMSPVARLATMVVTGAAFYAGLLFVLDRHAIRKLIRGAS